MPSFLEIPATGTADLESMLARLGVPAPRMLEFGTLEAIFACVSAGLGVTMLPRALAELRRHSRQL